MNGNEIIVKNNLVLALVYYNGIIQGCNLNLFLNTLVYYETVSDQQMVRNTTTE